MPADKPTELSRIKLKTWARQPIPMISKHSANLTPLPFGIRTWLWRDTYLLLFILMLWHRQAVFESKGDKLSSSAECRIRTQRVPETQSSADYMPADKPTELSRIKLKDLNPTARPYDQQAFSPPDPTGIWHSHLALAIYIFVVVITEFCSEIWNVHMWRWKGRFISYLKYHLFEFYLSIGSPLFRKTLLCGHWPASWAASLHWAKIQRKQSRLLTCCALCSTEHRPFGDTTTLCRLLHKFNGFLNYKIFKDWFEYLQCKK